MGPDRCIARGTSFLVWTLCYTGKDSGAGGRFGPLDVDARTKGTTGKLLWTIGILGGESGMPAKWLTGSAQREMIEEALERRS